MQITKTLSIGTLALSIGFGAAQPAFAKALHLNCAVKDVEGTGDTDSLSCIDPTHFCWGNGPQKQIVIPDGDALLHEDNDGAARQSPLSFYLACGDPAQGAVTLTPYYGASQYSAGGSWIGVNSACLPFTGDDYTIRVNDFDAKEVTLNLHSDGPILNAPDVGCENGK